MKSSKAEIERRVHAVPRVVFEAQQLTSYGGLVLFQPLFSSLELLKRLRECFAHVGGRRVFGLARVMFQLIVHVLLGFKRLRDRDYYADDPLVCRVLGVRRLPDVSTITRTLTVAETSCVEKLRALLRRFVVDRLVKLGLARVTVDFDGSSLSTTRRAEGSAVGYNTTRKGARGYYPLFANISQVGQFFDVLHRPGNVHDSRGAADFIQARILDVKRALPQAVVEARFDGAFYDDAIFGMLELHGVEYSATVPFLRFPWMRELVENGRWLRINSEWSYFESFAHHKMWDDPRRVIFVRRRRAVRHKGPLQLDLFELIDHEYEYKAIVTNKSASAAAVLRFHNGRGIQEAEFAECKQFTALGYIPCRRLVANQLFLLASLFAHNLARELQMRAADAWRGTKPTRAALLEFFSLGTLRHLLLRRAGRLTTPQRKLTLTIAASGSARQEFERILQYPDPA